MEKGRTYITQADSAYIGVGNVYSSFHGFLRGSSTVVVEDADSLLLYSTLLRNPITSQVQITDCGRRAYNNRQSSHRGVRHPSRTYSHCIRLRMIPAQFSLRMDKQVEIGKVSGGVNSEKAILLGAKISFIVQDTKAEWMELTLFFLIFLFSCGFSFFFVAFLAFKPFLSLFWGALIVL